MPVNPSYLAAAINPRELAASLPGEPSLPSGEHHLQPRRWPGHAHGASSLPLGVTVLFFERDPDDDLATIGGEGTGSRDEAASVGSVFQEQLNPLSWIRNQRRLRSPQKHGP
jgi:hypothetical protein